MKMKTHAQYLKMYTGKRSRSCRLENMAIGSKMLQCFMSLSKVTKIDRYLDHKHFHVQFLLVSLNPLDFHMSHDTNK